jgi:hypothetical protein
LATTTGSVIGGRFALVVAGQRHGEREPVFDRDGRAADRGAAEPVHIGGGAEADGAAQIAAQVVDNAALVGLLGSVALAGVERALELGGADEERPEHHEAARQGNHHLGQREGAIVSPAADHGEDV